jgi:hypothetical protein
VFVQLGEAGDVRHGGGEPPLHGPHAALDIGLLGIRPVKAILDARAA